MKADIKISEIEERLEGVASEQKDNGRDDVRPGNRGLVLEVSSPRFD